jgi:hypothetical protein
VNALDAFGTYTAGFWQPHVADGSLQQAPVTGLGVGSPQHAAGVEASLAPAAGLVGAADAPQQALARGASEAARLPAPDGVDEVDMIGSPGGRGVC